MRWKPSPRQLSVPLCLVALAVAFSCWGDDRSKAVPPLGATPHKTGTTFRVWAPFADSVAVKVNGGQPIPLKKEDGHPQADDTVWVADVPGNKAKAGDRYRYVITANGATKEFADPRARFLTGPEGDASSIIVDVAAVPTSFRQPSLGEMVIYELHLGTFHVPDGKQLGTFADAIKKLDYLKDLGVNAVEVMPLHQNARRPGNTPLDFNWGYDVVHFYALNTSYGTPQECKRFIKECHDRNIAVLIDVVYNHMADGNLLQRFGGITGPTFKDGIFFYGDDRETTPFGPRPDFGRPQVRAHVEENALMWLREYGADGLRWDSTVNIRNTNLGRNPEGEQLLRTTNIDYRKTDPRKISIAEDLQSAPAVTGHKTPADLEFDSQWDDDLWRTVRSAVCQVNDENRDVKAIKAQIERRIGGNAFGRVIYSENHDKVGHPNDADDGKPQTRLPALIDEKNNSSVFAKRRSTLAAAIVLTAPGVPMLFQGQEMLETRPFEFSKATPVDWKRAQDFKGLVSLYRDLIALRRNRAGKTGGLTAANVNVFRADEQTRTLAYHRFRNGGAGDDVVVVINLANQARHPLNIGFPREGSWAVRFNSGSPVYDREFTNGDSQDVTARAGAKDNLNFNGDVGIGPYSVVILSQD